MTTPDTPAHTPLPWQVIGSDPSEGFDCFWIKGQPSPMLRGFTQEIGCINGSQLSAEPSANAAFIVRACNSHYQLVDSLRAMQARECRSWCSEALNEHTRACVSARAALSQAGGE